ncbi:hypothetical protein BH18GEM1_BH18GEM1_19870 [soil metagenome]
MILTGNQFPGILPYWIFPFIVRRLLEEFIVPEGPSLCADRMYRSVNKVESLANPLPVLIGKIHKPAIWIRARIIAPWLARPFQFSFPSFRWKEGSARRSTPRPRGNRSTRPRYETVEPTPFHSSPDWIGNVCKLPDDSCFLPTRAVPLRQAFAARRSAGSRSWTSRIARQRDQFQVRQSDSAPNHRARRCSATAQRSRGASRGRTLTRAGTASALREAAYPASKPTPPAGRSAGALPTVLQ